MRNFRVEFNFNTGLMNEDVAGAFIKFILDEYDVDHYGLSVYEVLL